jgi:hypothetical protein
MKSNLITRMFRRIIFPRMKGEFLQSINNSNPSVLDVGCGNDCLTEPISKIKNKTNYYTWCYYGFQTIIWAEKTK